MLRYIQSLRVNLLPLKSQLESAVRDRPIALETQQRTETDRRTDRPTERIGEGDSKLGVAEKGMRGEASCAPSLRLPESLARLLSS